MKLLLLPDLAAMAILLSILYFLRIRHPREAVNLWLIGLLFQCCTWIPIWFFSSAGDLRNSAYFLLFVLYFGTAVLFQISLPRESLGRAAIVTGFLVWSFVFLSHSWAANHAGYDIIADEI